MAKWVTFYYGVYQGLKDYKEHRNRESAEEYFLGNYNKYFSLNSELRNFKAPYSYGFPDRKFYVMTKYKFDKLFGED